ncbi:SusC/RagA family TonB-linked outer membrane protein, partial [Bacteroides reticulotermitis]|uniref:SusC/RagA family TonB-linked outer membrane protein n=1 Tax=Bacteroides reticulotermitis TaxID=1133319 RepID=UPI003A862A79
MKISIFLMFIGIGVISASTSYGQNTVLTLKVHNKALKDVFREIESKSEYIFFYNDEAVNVNKRVDLSIEKGTISQILDKILDRTSRYKVEDRQVIIYKDNAAALAANAAIADAKDIEQAKVTINGKITDNEGEPLPGVSVAEKGTTNGVLTDIDGNYSIGVKDQNAVLVFTYLGHDTAEEKVGSRKTINVVLHAKSSQLEEVIVVAYGTQKKSSVTGAISVVNSDALKTVTTPNVNAMLQGKVAGVQVLNTSGRPGEAAQIRIRGKGTLNSSVDPLWVIDGVVSGTGAQLNPNEIESISVLKDAAATALYGSRATNGVILVTTKGGRTGEHKVDVAVKLGVSYQHLGQFQLMNSRELYDYTSSMANLESSGILGWFNEKLLHTDTDWFDLATKTALTQNYTVSYTGGGEKVRSFVSADYYTEEGTVKGYEYNRFSIRSNNDYKLSNTLTLKTKISGSYWNDDNRQHSISSAMTYLPWDYPYNEDGSVRTGKEDDWHGRDASNYLYNLQWNWARGKQLGVSGTVGAVWNIKDYLTFESNNNIGYRYHLTESYSDPRATGTEGKGQIANSNAFTTTSYTNQLLRFNKVLDNVHDVSAFLGYEYSDYKYESNNATGRGIPSNTEVLGVATTPYAVGGGKSEWAMQSVYFNANYTYNDKYMGQFSYRIDGSSRFSKDNRYGGFFTIGGGWSLHNEDFLKDVEYVNQLKLRASYGSIGNTPGSGDYGYLSVYSLNTSYNGIPAAFPNRLGNSNLTWEKCYETNIAVDARLFDRVNISVDYYDKNTSDLLYNVPLSSLSGYTSQYQNIGAVQNRGLEIAISPEIIKTKEIQWNAQFNLGFNKSEVKELFQGQQQISGNKIIKEGESLD